MLELLHYSDKETYNNLLESRHEYLDEERTANGTTCYKIKEKDKLPNDIASSTYSLLKRLFPRTTGYSRASIGYEENYLRYFTFRLPEHKIASSSLIAILNNSYTDTELSGRLQELFTGNSIKQISLINQISLIKYGDLTSKVSVHNYLYMLVWAASLYKIEYVRSILPKQLSIHYFPEEKQKEYAAEVKRMIEDAITTTYDAYQWAKIFSCLYPICYWDYDEGEPHQRHDPKTILSKEDITDLAETNFRHFLQRLGTLPPLSDLTYNNTPLHHFLKSSTTIVSMEEGYPDNASTQCLVLEPLIEVYKKQSNGNDFEAFTSHLDVDESLGYDYEDYLQNYLDIVRRTLGENKDYERLVRTCFNLTPEEIEQHLIKIHFKSPKERNRYKPKDPPEIYYL